MRIERTATMMLFPRIFSVQFVVEIVSVRFTYIVGFIYYFKELATTGLWQGFC